MICTFHAEIIIVSCSFVVSQCDQMIIANFIYFTFIDLTRFIGACHVTSDPPRLVGVLGSRRRRVGRGPGGLMLMLLMQGRLAADSFCVLLDRDSPLSRESPAATAAGFFVVPGELVRFAMVQPADILAARVSVLGSALPVQSWRRRRRAPWVLVRVSQVMAREPQVLVGVP